MKVTLLRREMGWRVYEVVGARRWTVHHHVPSDRWTIRGQRGGEVDDFSAQGRRIVEACEAKFAELEAA